MRELVWNARSQRIEIRFPFDPRLVAVVRELPGRRWHPEHKQWSVPRDSFAETARRLLPHGFAPAEPLRALLEDPEAPLPVEGEAAMAGAAAEPAVDPASVAEGRAEEETWSVSALNERVKALLRERLPFPFWVVGEVVGFDRNAHKANVFFTLAEKEEGDDAPRASATAVLFARAKPHVESTLARAGGGVALRDGVRVRVRVHVDLYPKTGSFQLVVEAIDPAFTLGEIALRRERILREIRAAGLAERNLALPFPRPPLRIALVTSLGSDAYNDFLDELARSGYAFRVSVADVHVQGERLEGEVLSALERFAREAERHDVLVITRGGGSRTELMGFDSATLAFAVARHPLKVLVGIGHQQDRSVLDEIASSAKTPTAAAAHLVALCAEAEESLRRAAERLGRGLARAVAAERGSERLRRQRLAAGAREALGRARERVLRARGELPRRGGRALLDRKVALRERGLAVASRFAARLATARARSVAERDRLARAGSAACRRAAERLARDRRDLARRPLPRLREAAARLDLLAERASARDPRRVLERGYAWLRRPGGRTIRSVGGLGAGDRIEGRLADGSFAARVDEVRPGPPRGSSPPSPAG